MISVEETKDRDVVTYDLQREIHMPIGAHREATTPRQNSWCLYSRHLEQKEDEEQSALESTRAISGSNTGSQFVDTEVDVSNER